MTSPSLVMCVRFVPEEGNEFRAHSLNPPFSEMFSWRLKEGGQHNPQLQVHGDLQETKQCERVGLFLELLNCLDDLRYSLNI